MRCEKFFSFLKRNALIYPTINTEPISRIYKTISGLLIKRAKNSLLFNPFFSDIYLPSSIIISIYLNYSFSFKHQFQ